jgi:glycosyltransferase involved in cell wall biosynthesis
MSSAVRLNITCVCHLAWEKTLFQRPQQLMLQMARRGHRVCFYGFPGLRRYLGSAERSGDLREPGGGELHFSNFPYSPYVRLLAESRAIVARWQLRQKVSRLEEPHVVWAYHPLLLRLVEELPRDFLVYDVMDQFSAFRKTHPKLTSDEQRLLEKADVVFTGGRSLDASTRAAGREETRCFPSGVDIDHFASAGTEKPATELSHFPRPIFGYIGAVDERVDLPLLRELARLRPNASIVLIGPVLGALKPLPPNVHILGARAYERLPGYLAAFDCCLLPFDVSRPVVQHVSPTKTPEYLAAGRPVISTPIPDVVEEWSGVVSIARDAFEFASACDAAVEDPPAPEQLREAAAQRTRTWEQIAAEMEALILQRVGAQRA